MNNIRRTDLTFILNEIAQELDIADSLFEEAESRYKAVGTWLGEGNSPLAIYLPVIYPQGSFLLGTVTKPLGERDEYDIDLVFEMQVSKFQATQRVVKNLVGDRLKDNETYRRMLDEEGRRCWTLQYANHAKFHMDVLPAVPNSDYQIVLKNIGVKHNVAEASIALTDKSYPNYDRIDPNWPRGNPKGYALWFRGRMIVQYETVRKNMAEVMKAEIQAVPPYKIKTPLQRSVQLIKRDRDKYFENKYDKPCSILMTTLAALSYNNEFDLLEALTNIVDNMLNHIETRAGIAWVPNPVDPLENFADRWQDRPGREDDFRDWQKKMRSDLNTLVDCYDIDQICDLLSQMFGERVSVTAVNRYKDHVGARPRNFETVVPIIRPNQPWGI